MMIIVIRRITIIITGVDLITISILGNINSPYLVILPLYGSWLHYGQ